MASPPPGSDVDTSTLLALAESTAAEAAALLVEGLSRNRVAVEQKSTATDLVTEMDRAAERLIVDRLLAARPDDGVVGEEGAATRTTSGIEWVIDPIDGTTNYVYGHPGFAVSIAARRADSALVGVVHDPLHAEVFTARIGAGAHRNGEPIRASGESRLGHALVGTGFSYETARRERQAHVLTRVLPAVRDIRRMGAASVDLCSVACGRLDAYYERGLQPWDHAAGALIATEAGASVGDLDGGPASWEFCLAASADLFGPLQDLLRRAGAAEA